MKIDFFELIKQIEGDGFQVVNIKLWKRYGDLSVEVSRASKGDFVKASEKYNGLLTEYNGQTAEVLLCRKA